MQDQPTADKIMSFYETLPEGELAYVDFHKYRYQYLLQIIGNFIEKHPAPSLSLLDIGPAYQTKLIRHFYPEITVHSLGHQHAVNDLKSDEMHFAFDLNDAAETWPEGMPHFDIILFCEVIEHIYTKPQILLQRLREIIKSHGWLIIQTPNAVAIHKRILMLLGRNPYQLLHENKMGHFREYTLPELKFMISESNLEPILSSRKNYFNPSDKMSHKLFRQFGNFFPAPWRDGITMVASPR